LATLLRTFEPSKCPRYPLSKLPHVKNGSTRRRVGYLAQDPRFYDYMTARETLCFIARFFYQGPRAEIESRVAETLDPVGLADQSPSACREIKPPTLQVGGFFRSASPYLAHLNGFHS
jgi:ABC-type ATPase involved in cell division